ncbi:PP2C family protein-serine/threonine phosphatase [Streptomyces sp. NPDC006553]|uniref:PP2C family protein-serine/threonine phosphatase n=1 Tax=unclassified Streptomyces TaxID=2593676 RepID=UPI002252F710|nr:PP2C family protein-serine/threonine phosphatase [Streptomyces sp. NBC_00233]MCX5232455.1 serine/threonine-protein phosphatase [Streptomyces sp. NBC_00233]
MENDTLGSVLADVLAASHRLAPRAIPELVQDAGRRLGLSGARAYVADLQQRDLVALPSPEQARAFVAAGGTADLETLPVDNSLAGRAYRTETVQLSRPDADDPERTGWIPVVDGIGRMGVLRVTAPELDASLLRRCEALADLIAMILAAKQPYSDLLAETMRTRAMSLQAELLWAFLPPRTIGTAAVTSSAVLEPAYEVGGDAYDHSLAGEVLHLTLLDAMGHDLASGGCSAAALAACRSARRAGGRLDDIAVEIGRTLDRWIPGRLLTCVIANLDTTTGRLDWINCGHPPPLLIRDRRVVTGALDRTPHPPLGLTGYDVPPPRVHSTHLQPGDRLLLFTDGVTEARSAARELFGEQRLADAVVRALTDGLPAPEALRRLIQQILVHQDQRLSDDATLLLTEWHPLPRPSEEAVANAR